MKKYIIRVVAFALLFCLCFGAAQGVLHYRWSGNEDLYTRNIVYAQSPSQSIDVLCFGTSEMFSGYTPIVGYEEAGVTGFNFAVSNRSAMTAYYQLLYTLEYQTPSVVICDFCCLFDDKLPKREEDVYRKVVECMPDKQLKEQLIRDICKADETQSYLYWKFPLLRYHSRWNELSEIDFTPDYRANSKYPSYQKGALFGDYSYKGELDAITPEFWDYTDTVPAKFLSQFSIHYYDLMIQTCQEKGITMVAVIPPKVVSGGSYAARWETTKEYLDSRGVPCLNYCTYEQVQRMGLILQEHYYDDYHLNLAGSVIFTKTLIQDLKEIVSLPDHRGDPSFYDEWDAPLVQFREKYPDL